LERGIPSPPVLVREGWGPPLLIIRQGLRVPDFRQTLLEFFPHNHDCDQKRDPDQSDFDLKFLTEPLFFIFKIILAEIT
jgi:hypothetical protein